MNDVAEHDAAPFDRAVNMARQSLYRFAALSLLDPRSGAWWEMRRLGDDPVPAAAAALVRSLPEARAQELAMGERPLEDLDPQRVLDRLPGSPERLNAQYERTFGLLVSGACPPYETEYVDNKFVFQRSQGLADIQGYYQAFGLTISSRHRERADHVVLELEFMAHLLQMERLAGDAASGAAEKRDVCRAAQVRFVKDHLAWWTPALARLLVRENPHGYYAAAGTFLAALVPVERALLRIPPPSGIARPSVADAAALCDGCQIAG